jgi:hypothetical protein
VPTIGFYTSPFEVYVEVNLRPDGAIRGKRRIVMWKVETYKVIAPRLCQLRTDELAP